ncbi:hypothetical protein DFJ74DRAFT_7272 [Hyaloraphidium curvatum]|nr:hypothetical protein DFJ74DRAFT_7272 [Hyaloraphidium curvatum]
MDAPVNFQLIGLEALLLLYKKGVLSHSKDVEAQVEQAYTSLPKSWKKKLRDAMDELIKAGLVLKEIEDTEEYYGVTDAMKSDIRSILRYDPNRSEWDHAVLEQLLGLKPTRAELTTRARPEAEAEADDPGKKRRRGTPAKRGDKSASLVTPPATPADAAAPRVGKSKATVPRSRQKASRVEEEAEEAEEFFEEEAAAEEEAEYDEEAAADEDYEEESPAAKRARTDDAQFEEDIEDEMAEEEDELESPEPEAPKRSGWFGVIRNLMGSRPKEVAQPSAGESQDTQLSAPTAVDDAEEVDGEEPAEQAVVPAPKQSAGFLGGLFGRKTTETTETVQMTVDESSDSAAELERIKREAAEAAGRLDVIESLLEGMSASTKQQVTTITRRFETERLDAQHRIGDLENQLANSRVRVRELTVQLRDLEERERGAVDALGQLAAPREAPTDLENLLRRYEEESEKLGGVISRLSDADDQKQQDAVDKLRKDLQAARDKSKADLAKATKKFEDEKADLLRRIAELEKAAPATRAAKGAESQAPVASKQREQEQQKLVEEKQGLENRVAELEKRLSDSKARIGALNGELGAAKDKLKSEVRAIKDAAEKEKAELLGINTDLSTQVTAAAARILSMETDLLATRREKDGLQARVLSLLRELKEKEDAGQRSSADARKQAAEATDLKRQLAAKEAALQKLQDRIGGLEKELSAGASGRMGLESELAIVNKEKEALLTRLERLFATSTDHDERLERAQSELRERSMELVTLKRELSLRDGPTSALQTQIAGLQRDLDRTRLEKTRIESRAAELGAQVAQLQGELSAKAAELEDVNGVRRRDADRFKAELEEKNDALRALRKAAEQKDARIEALEAARLAAAERLRGLEEQAADVLAKSLTSETNAMVQIQDLSLQLEDARAALARAEDDKAEQASQIESANARDVELIKDQHKVALDGLEAALALRGRELEDLQGQLLAADAKAQEKEREADELTKLVRRRNQELKDLQESVRTSDDRTGGLLSELEKLKRDLAAKDDELKVLEGELAAKDAAALRVREELTRLSTLELANKELDQRARLLQKELDDATKALDAAARSASEEQAKLADQVKKLESRLDRTRKELNDAAGALAERDNRVAELQGQLQNLDAKWKDALKQQEPLRAEIDRHKKIAENVERQLTQSLSKLKKAQDAADAKQKELDEVTRTLVERSDEVTNLTAVRARLEQMLAQREDFYKRLERDAAVARQEDAAMAQALDAIQVTTRLTVTESTERTARQGASPSRRRRASPAVRVGESSS